MDLPGSPTDDFVHRAVLQFLEGDGGPSAPELDRLTRLVAGFFSAPVILVSGVGPQEHSCLSSQGLTPGIWPEVGLFCAQTLLRNDIMIVPDASSDERFASHPLVLGAEKLIFYAGCPLRSRRGRVVGTLGLWDRKARHFDDRDCLALRDFAHLVEQHLHRIESQLIDGLSGQQFGQAFLQTSLGMALVAPDGRLQRVNRQWALMLDREPSEFSGAALADVLFGPERQSVQNWLGHPDEAPKELIFTRPDGRLVWCLLGMSELLPSPYGEPSVLLVATDISARKASEQALAVLQLELEHRVESRTLELSQAIAQLHHEAIARESVQRALEQEKEHFKATLANATDAFIETDSAGWVTDWNRAATQALGWTAVEAVGRSVIDLIVPEHLSERQHVNFEALFSKGTQRSFPFDRRLEAIVQHRDGRLFPVEISFSENWMHGQRRLNAFMHDISERKAAERELRASRAQLRLLADNLPALVGYVDQNLIYRFCNRTHERWFGLPLSSIVDHDIRKVSGLAADAGLMAAFRLAQAGQSTELNQRMLTVQGEVRAHISLIPDTNSGQLPLGFYILAQDVTEQYELQQRLIHEASHDALTGLPNRRAFLQRLAEALARARRVQSGLALLYLDLDGFKQYNDTHGHEFGDAVLRQFARCIQSVVRETDTVSRLAGDEFTVILEGLVDPLEHAAQIATKLVDRLLTPYVIGGVSVRLAASIGVAVLDGASSDPQSSVESLLSRADAAMYRAKAAGKGQFVLG